MDAQLVWILTRCSTGGPTATACTRAGRSQPTASCTSCITPILMVSHTSACRQWQHDVGKAAGFTSRSHSVMLLLRHRCQQLPCWQH